MKPVKLGHRALLSMAALGAFGAAPAAATEIFFGENLTPRRTVTGAPVTAREQFAARLAGTSTESFESFTRTPTSLSFTGSAGTITAALSGGNLTTNGGGSGGFATSGSRNLNFSSSSGFTITFDTAVSAIGFYGTDIGDINGQLSLQVTRATGIETILVPHTRNAPDGSLLFFGLIDKENPFTAIRFFNTGGTSDVLSIDDIVVGDPDQVAAVPEPASWAMMIGGFGVMGASLRRRQRVAIARVAIT